jgi:perosamine synthetase
MSKLAILGGPKVRTKNFPAYRVIGEEEKQAAARVFESGIFSRFLGCWHEDFYGGPEVQALEKEWAEHFGVKHAIAVNSATSGLYCAVGAAGIEPGDEVIVSPYTMSASAVAPLIYNAIPVFADIEEDYFCLSPESIEEKITPKTKAIIVVDIFGLPYDADRINAIAKKHNLIVIEDCAQAPGAKFGNKFAGTLGDIGIYSLNYHKHIHTGEGGILVTDNDELADKLRLIRNHAEAVVEAKGYSSLVNMLGFNYRMTEIEASIAREQLKKLDRLLEERISNVNYLSEKFARIPCLEPAKIRENCKHVFYVHVLKYNQVIAGIHRDKFVEAVKAELMPIELRETEGVKVGAGYVKPLYLQPLYQQKIAYGQDGCPWTCKNNPSNVEYPQGLCPVVEKMYYDVLITHELMRPGMTITDLDDVVNAFLKVWDNREQLFLR